ncbi:MAG TPA: hypothetical protein VD929_08940 [Caulobacteraceae bacterium]|nr:hypothetical protein [Caulobacteraceae bacterium]
MTAFRPKLWTVAGLALTLAACGGEQGGEAGKAGEAGAPTAASGEGEGGEGEGGEASGTGAGEAGATQAYANVPADSRTALRLAHLKGFFLTAQAVSAAEGAEAAAALAGQGVLEVYEPEAAALKAAGVDEAALRAAAQSGDPAALKSAVATLDAASRKAGGNNAAVVKHLASMSAGMYAEATKGGALNPIEYQHAYGAALAAKALADADPKLAAVRPDLQKLVALWPSPTAPADAAKAAKPGQVLAQASRVELALSGA